MKVLQRLLALLLFLSGSLAPGLADDAATTHDGAIVARTDAPIAAHPALWIVRGRHGTVYLLGSVHILPPNLVWRTPEIAEAIGKADVFEFEIPTDDNAMVTIRDLIAQRGSLPPGASLRDMLTMEGKADLDRALVLAQLPLAAIDGKRPWLASLILSVGQMVHENGLSPGAGLDVVLAQDAAARHKELRYLETAQEQIELLAPKDSDLELEAFQAGLKKFARQSTSMDMLLDAWASGDPGRIDKLFNESLTNYPKARRLLLDDRNRTWVRKIRSMLDREDKIFLITVGAAHLVGRNGVPNLLREAGYKVVGP